MSEPRCTFVLAAAVLGAVVSASLILDSVEHNRKVKAWLWVASFVGTSFVAAYCFGRLLVWEAA